MEVVSDNQARARLLMYVGQCLRVRHWFVERGPWSQGFHAGVRTCFLLVGRRSRGGVSQALCAVMVVQTFYSITRGDTSLRDAGMGVLPQTRVMPSFS